jgi:hypothetical protein
MVQHILRYYVVIGQVLCSMSTLTHHHLLSSYNVAFPFRRYTNVGEKLELLVL